MHLCLYQAVKGVLQCQDVIALHTFLLCVFSPSLFCATLPLTPMRSPHLDTWRSLGREVLCSFIFWLQASSWEHLVVERSEELPWMSMSHPVMSGNTSMEDGSRLMNNREKSFYFGVVELDETVCAIEIWLSFCLTAENSWLEIWCLSKMRGLCWYIPCISFIFQFTQSLQLVVFQTEPPRRFWLLCCLWSSFLQTVGPPAGNVTWLHALLI